MNKRVRLGVAAFLFPFFVSGFQTSTITESHAQTERDRADVELGFVPGRVLVQFRAETLSLREVGLVAEFGANDAGEITGTGVHVLELPEGTNAKAVAKALRSRPEIEFAELDRIVAVQDIVPNDPWYTNWEWYLPKISAPTAWSTTTGISNITIAIIDTGVDGTHEDLASKMVPGWNIYNNNSDTSDVYGHGTLVAGTAGAASNNNIGVASVAWGCGIMPVRVSATDGTASYSNIASGLTWAADHGARVANVSYIVSDSSTVTSAAQYFQNKGGVVTVSAGNYSTFDSSSDNPYVLTVSATDPNDVLYSWSNTGNNVDLAAPGWSYTTVNRGGYSTASGTSISAPIVAGVAALVLSVNPTLLPTQVQDILKQSADDLGPAGWDPNYGAGRVNAARAVSLAAGGTGTSDATPPTINFASPSNGATISGTTTVQLSASDNVGVASVSLSIDGTIVGTDTASPYAFTWNTTSVANGAHTLTATARDAAGNATSVTVSVTVSNIGDTTAPTISITSPANGSTVSGNVSVYVNAADNVGVGKVELYADGGLVATATSAPFTTKWNVRRVAPGAHALQCKAYDAAGNLGTSATVTVYK